MNHIYIVTEEIVTECVFLGTAARNENMLYSIPLSNKVRCVYSNGYKIQRLSLLRNNMRLLTVSFVINMNQVV